MKFDVCEGPRSRVHIVKSGPSTGTPLLLIHGSPGSWKDWSGLIEGPERLRSFRVWAVDRPGFGLSERSRFEPKYEEKVEDLVQIAEELAYASGKPLWIAGHSYGAALGARIVLEVSKRGYVVAGVVLISGVLCQWSNHPRWYHRYVLNSPLRWIWPLRYLRGAAEMVHVRSGLLELEHLWKEFPCPIGLIHSTDDRLIVVENSEYVKSKAESRVVFELWLDGLGHRVPQKRPDLIKSALLEMGKIVQPLGTEKIGNGLN